MAEPLPRLFPQDFDILLKLVSRAQVAVGDVPAILPTLQRLEAAKKDGRQFVALQVITMGPELRQFAKDQGIDVPPDPAVAADGPTAQG
jgi:hypothetical protein